MLYSILIYGSEAEFAGSVPEQQNEVLSRHAQLRKELIAQGRLGPVMRLTPHAGKTVRRYKDRRHITDGPFAETKEQLMGIYVIDCDAFDDAVAAAERLSFETGVFEIRPITLLNPGVIPTNMPPD